MVRGLSRYKKEPLIGGITSYVDTWVIGDDVYTQKFVRKIADDADGSCDPGTHTLYCRMKMSRIETFRTFIHEVIHGMEDAYEFDLPHKTVEKLEICFADFLIDNAPALAKVLFP